MSKNLTDQQKVECQKVLNAMVNYFWSKIKMHMLIEGVTFERALELIRLEILND